MPLFGRQDGDLVPGVPAYRRIMPFIMRTRTESAVLFEQQIDATRGLAFIKAWNENHAHRISFMHLLLYGLVQTLHTRPRLNRFTMGGALYQRRGIWISFSGKKAFNDDSPVVVVKQQFDPAAAFEAMVAQTHGAVGESKSDKPSHVDKELSVFLRFPAFVLRAGVKVLLWLDAWNLLPHTFTKDDPLYASAFIANLGSIKLDAAYHHNFEYGSIPIFVTIGRVQDAVVALPDGSVGTRKQVVLRWTYDERVEDGLYCAQGLDFMRKFIEAPDEWIPAGQEGARVAVLPIRPHG